ncbi:MAG: HTTM domain-containing protein [Acidimicrobiales bacterium]|nr:HTTM domain-containing protein [Acidimicrobiales bacterium]
MTDWLHRTIPAERIAIARIVIGAYSTAYLVARAASIARLADLPASHWQPVGVAHVLPGGPLDAGVVWSLMALGVVAGTLFTLGWRLGLTGPLFGGLLLVLTTYRNSWGQVFHTENLMVLHVLILAAAGTAGATASLDARRAGRWRRTVDGWPVRAMGIVTVITYVLAGVTKLRVAGGSWIDGDNLRHWIAYDNLRKIELGDLHAPLGGWLVQHAWVFTPIAVATLVVELGAPIALLSTSWARRWALAAWAFHVGVVALMAIVFPYPLLGIAYLPLLDAETLPGARRLIAWLGPTELDLRTTPQSVEVALGGSLRPQVRGLPASAREPGVPGAERPRR